jgi:hypothetical protein
MQLVIRNLSGLPYVIEASDLFEEWSPIATNPGIMPQATNVDSAAIDAPLRFYRTHAVVP